MPEGSRVAAYELRQDHGFEGLTARQWRFVQLVFGGLDQSEAYRQAYDSASSPSNLAANASALMKNPKVSAKLANMRQVTESNATLAPLVTRDFVLNGIMQLALHADKDATKLRAYELLGKTVGVDLFREHVVKTTEERTVADIERELRDKLQSLRQTIDGTARPIESPAPSPNRKRKPRA